MRSVPVVQWFLWRMHMMEQESLQAVSQGRSGWVSNAMQEFE